MKKYFNIDLFKIILSTILFILSYFFTSKIKLVLIILSYIIISYEIYFKALKNLFNGEIFDENFLMIIATLGAFYIKSYEESVIVMLLFSLGEYLSDLAVSKSKKSITNLLNLKVDTITLEKNNENITIPVEKAQINDIFIVKPGERIALDGQVISGTSYLDTYSLTGESLPKKVTVNDYVLSGCINRESILKIKATTTSKTTTASRIIQLLDSSSENKSKTETFFTKFSKIYTPTVVILALLIATIPSLITKNYHSWLYKALIFLVTSCPCALVISIPLGYFCGLGIASKKGIIIKGSKELDKLTSLDYLVLDKTGTLTEGNFQISEIKTYDISEKNLLRITASAEENSIHPIATLIKAANKEKLLKTSNYKEISGKGISCTIDHQKILIGNKKLMLDNNIKIDENTEDTVVFISIDSKYKGYIKISDQEKITPQDISLLKKNITNNVIILSGDTNEAVTKVAKKLHITSYQSELLPEDKVNYVKELMKKGSVMFVGDGINDAPVIKIADIGVAMGKIGSDVAIETSDVVLMNDNLMSLISANKIARFTRKKVLQSITFALFIKLLVLILALLGISTIWLAVFADVGVTLLSILNVLTIFLKEH